MSETRYQGVKITTRQTPSGRWNASSGYAYADADTEAAAIEAVKPKIRAARKAESNRPQAAPRKAKKYRITLATGDTFDVEAFSKREATDEANRRLQRRSMGRW